MKVLILTICSFLLFACSSQQQKIVDEVQPQTEARQKIYQDENGNLINEDGWEVPKFETKNKEFIGERDLLNVNGELIKIYFYSYTPKDEVIIKEPFSSQELNEKYRPTELIHITERRGNNQAPYCYNFTIKKKTEANNKSNSNTESYHDPIVYQLCDLNGDGIFEFRPQGHSNFLVPSWVK